MTFTDVTIKELAGNALVDLYAEYSRPDGLAWVGDFDSETRGQMVMHYAATMGNQVVMRCPLSVQKSKDGKRARVGTVAYIFTPQSLAAFVESVLAEAERARSFARVRPEGEG